MQINQNVIAAFAEAPLWYLATCGEGGPNVVPVGFKWVEYDCLLIADRFFGRTRDDLGRRRRVAVSVGLLNPKRGFQVRATAEVHRHGPVLERVCQLLRSGGVDATPYAALEIPFEETYDLTPGPDAGKRIA